MTRRHFTIGLLALGHGIGDFNGGLLLVALSGRNADPLRLFIIYNIFGFLGQPVAGWLSDRVNQPVLCYLVGTLFSAASLLLALAGGNPGLAVVFAGAASAAYHSGGGALVWALGNGRSAPLSIFAAPGVIGLALGMTLGLLASPHWIAAASVAIAIIGVASALLLASHPAVVATSRAGAPTRSRTWAAALGFAILAVIAARSFVWTLGQQAFFPIEDAVPIAIAASLGKLSAAVLGDRLRWRPFSVASLALSSLLFLISTHAHWALYPAVAALQSSTGPLIAMAIQRWPLYPASASGLAQGLAIGCGGAPVVVLALEPSSPLYLGAFVLLISAIAAWLLLRPPPFPAIVRSA